MEKRRLVLSSALLIVVFLSIAACHPDRSGYEDLATDSATVAKGQRAFADNCSACHNFRQDGIGPQLAGVTRQVSADWLRRFIRNPESVLKSDDERGQKLLARYKTVMPSFSHYAEDEMTAIIAYLNTKNTPEPASSRAARESLTDPIPSSIAKSDLVADIELVTTIPASAKKGLKTRITKLDFIPGSDRVFVVDIRGKLYELQDNKPAVYMDMATLKPKFVDKPGLATGFGSFAFHPDFLHNGLLYTSHTEATGSAIADFHYADSIPVAVQWVITEWKSSGPRAFPFKGTGRELFRINVVTGIHGVQELTFNPNSKPGDEDYGLLYIGVGDGGCTESGFPFLVQNTANPWGSILRIDPQGNNSRNKQYGIPPTNPFVKKNDNQALGEVFAYGFRNPHRITWTTRGQMLVSHIGQAHVEAVDVVQAGRNYGWPIREGTFMLNPAGDLTQVFPLPEDDTTYGVTYPVAQYDHDEGAAISGGFEYTGEKITALRDKYLFADMNNGRLYYLKLADIRPGIMASIKEWRIAHEGTVVTTAQLCGSKRVDLRFGRDHKGDIYFFSKPDGKIWRLAGAHEAATKL